MALHHVLTRSARLVLYPGTLALLAACSAATAGAGDRTALLLSDKPAPREGCRVVFTPNPLPPVSQIADSAGLATAVASFARQNPISGGGMRALYSVAFDETGEVSHVRGMDYLLPSGRAQEFEQVVRRHLTRQQPGGPWSVRLLVLAEGAPRFRVGRSEQCPPIARTRFRLRASATAQQQRPQPVRVRMLVDADGRVRSTQLLSRSGDADLDRWVIDTLQGHRFTPGLLDGVPTAMTHEETVAIEARP